MPSKRVPTKQKRKAEPKPAKKPTPNKQAPAKQADAKQKAPKQDQAKPAQRSAPKARKSRKISWRPIVIAACIVVFVIALMYPVGREYYQTLRKEQRLQAQIDAVTERNEAVAAENEALQTPEGIENQARSEQGLVQEGEHSVVVTNEDGVTDSASRLPDHLNPDDIAAPQTWYYSILDFIFFVHE